MILFVSIYLVLSIDTRLFDERFLPKNATSLRAYMKSQFDDYDIGPVIMFVIPPSVNYQKKKNQLAMRRIVQQCLNEKTTSDFHLLWLDQEKIQTILTGKDPLEFRITPYSQNDIMVNEGKNRTTIQATRFYCQYRSYTGKLVESIKRVGYASILGDGNDLRVMDNMYRYAEESSMPSVFPYSIIFSHYESLRQIRFETYLLILILSISTLIVTLLVFFSLVKSLLVFIHLLIVLGGSLTCLYLFHRLTFNFANALWLYIVPVIFVETLLHASFNLSKSKWKYNRVILSLIISLIIFSFFPIETYMFLLIRNSLIYQAILCLIAINLLLPSWNAIRKTCLKKKQPTIHETNPVTRECQNLVHGANGI